MHRPAHFTDLPEELQAEVFRWAISGVADDILETVERRSRSMQMVDCAREYLERIEAGNLPRLSHAHASETIRANDVISCAHLRTLLAQCEQLRLMTLWLKRTTGDPGVHR
jgi:hypothetical protein